jgi:hypothetical protein
MSIWSTFKTMQVHDADLHSEATPGQCGCPEGGNKVRLSSSWYGFPLRLGLDAAESMEQARVALTREQARELGQALIAWADHDEQRATVARITNPEPRTGESHE